MRHSKSWELNFLSFLLLPWRQAMPPGYTHTLAFIRVWKQAYRALLEIIWKKGFFPSCWFRLAHNSNSIIHPCGSFLFFPSLDCLLMHHQSSPELGQCSYRRALFRNQGPVDPVHESSASTAWESPGEERNSCFLSSNQYQELSHRSRLLM